MIGTIIVYIIMICAVLGAIGAIRDAEYGIGKEFMNGIHTVGHIFVPAKRDHGGYTLLNMVY